MDTRALQSVDAMRQQARAGAFDEPPAQSGGGRVAASFQMADLSPEDRAALEVVMDTINQSAQRDRPRGWFGMGLPHVPPPTYFQPEPTMTGVQPADARFIHKMLTLLNPSVKEQIRSVSQSPVPPAGVRQMLQGAVGAREAVTPTRANIVGAHDPRDRSVWLKPSLPSGSADLRAVALHEIGHAGGLDEPTADRTSQALGYSGIDPNPKALEALRAQVQRGGR